MTDRGDDPGGSKHEAESRANVLLTAADQIELLQQMQLIRAFDSQLSSLYTSGLVRGSSHPALGQEAVAVGACSALRSDDYITSTHRGHGHAIAKGADVRRMMAELLGRSDGYCRGKGGSMHIADFERGMLGANGIVGGGFGIATGAALSAQLRSSGQIALCFFGDGAVNQGAFLETGNLAAIWKLPLVLLCENNQFAMSARPDEMTGVASLVMRGQAIGIDAVDVDGMDVLAVHDAVRGAVDAARSGAGPRLVVAACYRYEGHFAGDTMAYRDPAELVRWRTRDPIAAFARKLQEAGHLTTARVDELERLAKTTIDEAIEFATGSPLPAATEALEDIFA